MTLCLTLSPSLCVFLLPRCISKLPPWPSLSACPPLCLWGCSTCPRSTSSSSTPSRTYPNENAALRWGGQFDLFNLISNKPYSQFVEYDYNSLGKHSHSLTMLIILISNQWLPGWWYRRSWQPPPCRGNWARREETGPTERSRPNYVRAWRPTVSKRTPNFYNYTYNKLYKTTTSTEVHLKLKNM